MGPPPRTPTVPPTSRPRTAPAGLSDRARKGPPWVPPRHNLERPPRARQIALGRDPCSPPPPTSRPRSLPVASRPPLRVEPPSPPVPSLSHPRRAPVVLPVAPPSPPVPFPSHSHHLPSRPRHLPSPPRPPLRRAPVTLGFVSLSPPVPIPSPPRTLCLPPHLKPPTPLAVDHGLAAPPSDEPFESSGPYPELVGCLMYLMTCTRPDIAYPLSVLARFFAPGRHRPSHWYAAKRVAKYVAGTSGMGLVLGGKHPVTLTGFSDSSWADDAESLWSTQGYCFSLGIGAVLWRATRASSVSSSSCEAEVYAAAMAAQELRWLSFLLIDLGERPHSPLVLFADNRSAILLCKEPGLVGKAKHIQLRYFLLRELQ
ncbi:unnamed protein product [Closterium sp. NIES-54]